MTPFAGFASAILALVGLHQRGGCIGRDDGAVCDGVLPHRVHDRRADGVAGFFDVAAHHATPKLDALVLDVLLEPVVRHAQRELLHHDVGDDRRMQQAARKEALRCRHTQHRGSVFAWNFVLRSAFDQHCVAAPAKYEVEVFLEPDPLGGTLELFVQDLEQDSGQVADRQIPTAGGLGFRLVTRRCSGAITTIGRFCLGDGLVQLLLEQLVRVEQAAERELQLTRLHALGLVAVDAPLQQLIFVRQVDDGLAKRFVLRIALPHAGLYPDQLHLECRHGCGQLRRR